MFIQVIIIELLEVTASICITNQLGLIELSLLIPLFFRIYILPVEEFLQGIKVREVSLRIMVNSTIFNQESIGFVTSVKGGRKKFLSLISPRKTNSSFVLQGDLAKLLKSILVDLALLNEENDPRSVVEWCSPCWIGNVLVIIISIYP